MSEFSVLALSGSLREASFNSALIRAAQRLAPAGMTIERYRDLGAVPPFNEDVEPAPPAAVVDLRERIAAADALLIATPEYNYGVPGVLKNALDWASRPSFPITSWVSRSPTSRSPSSAPPRPGWAPSGRSSSSASSSSGPTPPWSPSRRSS
ncbi:NADPH-dependent FMN reductase [Micromonospora sp. CB01531]|uniref:NADPH-dependent FMN reductase n=1 Tax=Micromonospora sp. CB01531 TaxID=1718947 RepID=UPI000A5A3E16|nr:NADPH-dependent FMN reductase [Micromonospora sp. CB01531]